MPSASDGDGDAAELPFPDASTALTPSSSRDRPLLAPTGRKLRHLSAITLRNLGTSAGDNEHAHGPFLQVQSPTPDAQSKALEDDDARDETEEAPAGGRRIGRRRRSTLRLLEVGGLKRWEGVVKARRADVFFSLHVKGVDEPIYISEVVKKCMNPDFQSFDLTTCGPAISRRDELTVKIWSDLSNGSGFRLLLNADIHLAGLRFIGKSLETFRHPLPQNCIVFFLTDGCYTAFWDMPEPLLGPALRADNTTISTSTSSAGDGAGSNLISSSSYDALMKLTTLEDCIHDAALTTQKLTTQITTILTRESPNLRLSRAVSQARARRTDLDRALATEAKRLSSAQQKRNSLRASLAARRAAMAVGRKTQDSGERYLGDALEGLQRCQRDLASTREAIEAQRKRIVETLSRIYPIEPVRRDAGARPRTEGGEVGERDRDRALAFEICGMFLPSTGHEDEDEAVTAAALGYVAHVVYLLAFYLGVPLRYPVQPVGSSSFVKDPISVIQGARTFPLWSRGTVLYRFEYAIFLVNKDIEQLMAARDMHAVDIRHTLPNLKNLMLSIIMGSNYPYNPAARALRLVSNPATGSSTASTTATNSRAPSPLLRSKTSPLPPKASPTSPSFFSGSVSTPAHTPTKNSPTLQSFAKQARGSPSPGVQEEERKGANKKEEKQKEKEKEVEKEGGEEESNAALVEEAEARDASGGAKDARDARELYSAASSAGSRSSVASVGSVSSAATVKPQPCSSGTSTSTPAPALGKGITAGDGG